VFILAILHDPNNNRVKHSIQQMILTTTVTAAAKKWTCQTFGGRRGSVIEEVACVLVVMREVHA